MIEKRCATMIPGFDALCEGGLVPDSINLLMGNSGSGKSTFCLQHLFNGALKSKESGLYITFENEVEDLRRVMDTIGLDMGKIDKPTSDSKMYILKYDFNKGIKEFQDDLVDMISKYDIKRICLDPINIFALEFSTINGISIRRQLYDFLNLLRKLNVCVIITGETDESSSGIDMSTSEEISFCKYLSDGVIQLYSSGLSGSGDRAIRITKMRITDHVRGPVGMELTKKGMNILSPE